MLGVHCENGDLVDELIQSYVSQGKLAPHYHPLSRPAAVEAEAVARYLMIAEMADLPVNIVHLSTKRSLEAVERARQRGQSVYVETCPQYLLLDDHLYDAPNFEAENMSAHRHYANERINRLCGKELKRGNQYNIDRSLQF